MGCNKSKIHIIEAIDSERPAFASHGTGRFFHRHKSLYSQIGGGDGHRWLPPNTAIKSVANFVQKKESTSIDKNDNGNIDADDHVRPSIGSRPTSHGSSNFGNFKIKSFDEKFQDPYIINCNEMVVQFQHLAYETDMNGFNNGSPRCASLSKLITAHQNVSNWLQTIPDALSDDEECDDDDDGKVMGNESQIVDGGAWTQSFQDGFNTLSVSKTPPSIDPPNIFQIKKKADSSEFIKSVKIELGDERQAVADILKSAESGTQEPSSSLEVQAKSSANLQDDEQSGVESKVIPALRWSNDGRIASFMIAPFASMSKSSELISKQMQPLSSATSKVLEPRVSSSEYDFSKGDISEKYKPSKLSKSSCYPNQSPTSPRTTFPLTSTRITSSFCDARTLEDLMEIFSPKKNPEKSSSDILSIGVNSAEYGSMTSTPMDDDIIELYKSMTFRFNESDNTSFTSTLSSSSSGSTVIISKNSNPE